MVNGKECVYYEKNYNLVVVVGSTVSPFFTEVDEIHTSVGLWTNHTVWSSRENRLNSRLFFLQ